MNQKISTLLISCVKVFPIRLWQKTIINQLVIGHARHIGDSVSIIKRFLKLSTFPHFYFFPIKFASDFYNLEDVDWCS